MHTLALRLFPKKRGPLTEEQTLSRQHAADAYLLDGTRSPDTTN